MNTVYHSAFSTADRHFKAMLNRIEYYNDMSISCTELGRSLDARVYMQLMVGQIEAACALIDQCYEMEFITRSEAFNIKHWLYWYDDPNRLDPGFYFFEDFRYE